MMRTFISRSLKTTALCLGLLCVVATEALAKVWIVVNVTVPKGTAASMAFNNPSAPNMTLEECKASLSGAVPHLLPIVQKQPKLAKAKLQSAACVVSDTDPVKKK
jgi:hypothetical protein